MLYLCPTIRNSYQDLIAKNKNTTMRFFLSAYTIRVYSKNNEKEDKSSVSEKNYKRLDKFCDDSDFMKNFLENLSTNPIINDHKQVTMKVSRLEIDQSNRLIFGIIDSGLYGNSSTLVDKETFKEVFKKESRHSDVLPFFFLLSIPKNKNESILILERISEKGIRKPFDYILQRNFKNMFPNFNIDIGHLIPSQMAEDFIKRGTIKTLRFIKFNIPHDKIDALEEGHEEILFDREVVYKAKSLPIKNRLLSIFKPGKTTENLFEMKDLNQEEYDSIKVEIELGGSRKTINLNNFSKIRNYLDISYVSLLNGQPEFNSIKKIAFEFHDKLSNLMYSELR
jgi:hypothetical protein